MSLPYFPLFPDDFEADTAHLSMAEDGAYNRLLRLCWRSPRCQIPAEEAWLFRKLRARTDEEMAAVRIVIEEYFDAKSGMLTNPKLLKIWNESNASYERRAKAGSKGGSAKAMKTNKTDPSNATPMLKQPEPEPIEKEIEANASPKKVPKATRLPEDWRVPLTLGEWAVEEGMPPDVVRREAAKFRDYWRAQPGQKGVKLDWPATWRNWVRKWIESSQPKRVAQDDFWTGKVVS